MFAGFLGPAKLQALMVLDPEPIQVLMEIVPRHGGASSRGSIPPSRGPHGVAALLSVQMPKLSVRYPTRRIGVSKFLERNFERSAKHRAADVSRERQSRRRCAWISAERIATACSMQQSISAPSMVHLTRSSASALKNYGASALNLESRESLGSPRQNDS
jgi:hypothetical protein